MTRVCIIGAGGHGRELLQGLRDADVEFAGFFDDREPDRSLLERLDAPWLGPLSRLHELHKLHDAEYLIGVGTGRVRREIDGVATAHGLAPFTFVHPLSSVGSDVDLHPGAVVFAFATVTTNIVVGRHTHVGRGAAVGHDSELGDYVSIYPLAAVSGNVTLENGVTVGTTASIKQGVRVQQDATIGSGAAVVSDIPAGAVAVGVPARFRAAD